MKRIIVALSMMLIATSLTAGNAFVLPRDQKGDILQGDGYAGSSKSKVSLGSETLVFSGKGVAYGLVLSTGATSSYAILRDTDTANGSGSQVLPNLMYNATTNTTYTFPQGVRMDSGLTLEISGAGTEDATVLYLDEE